MAEVKARTSTTQVVEGPDGSFVSPAVPDPPKGLYAETDPDCSTLNVAEGGFAGVTDAHVARYATDGYLLVRNAFGDNVTQSALAAIDTMCAEKDDRFAKACEGCKHDPERASLGFDSPGIQFEAAGAGVPKGQRARFVRKLKNFHGHSDALDRICYDGESHRLVARLIGKPDTSLDIFQSIALLKLAHVGREKPWHQDQAYFNIPIAKTPNGAPTHVVGVWVAIEPATISNGCMQVIPNRLAPFNHFQRRDWQICDDDITPLDAAVALPMNPGDALYFSGLAVHGTPPNKTDQSRKAVQLHLIPSDYPRCTTDERLTVFGNEGKVCEC
eukprot:m.211848 g.211848  ORF g.211848 m.211848 type:complete len:329 (+) comp25705_c0_seq1:38-1024(+)